jgi:protein-disulfide isomerase
MPISKALAALAAGVLALSLASCNKPAAAENAAFDAKVHAYLLAHPEVIQEAVDKLQANQDAETAAKTKASIDANRQAIEHDQRDFVANPNGKVTVTEFYDYLCPYCILAAPKVVALIQANPDVRFVFKEFPIHGPVAEHAARGAIAVKAAGGDYVGVYKTLMATHPLDDATINRILAAAGVTPAMQNDPKAKAAADQQLSDVRKLALDQLGVQGTPAFIIGGTMVPGADMDSVQAAIAAQRKAEKP